jgi:hypothetical protein
MKGFNVSGSAPLFIRENIIRATQHRPLNHGSETFPVFVKKSIENIQHLMKNHPEIDLVREYEYFNSFQ